MKHPREKQEKRGLSAKKSLGQNFLTNEKIAESIARSAEITPDTTVLEIGPGTGMLTRALLKEGARVVAIEADDRAIPLLEEDFQGEIASKRLVLLHGDIRTTSLKDLPLPKKYSVVANIPYYLSGMLFSMMLESEHQPETLVFLVQKEVAERVVRTKKESILSLSIKIYGTPSYEGTVSRGNFRPQPGVDSAILKIKGISKKKLGNIDEKAFFHILKTGFKARRKHLLGNLTEILPREQLTVIFEKIGLNVDVRGEDMSLTQWLTLIHEMICPQRGKKEKKA